MWDSVTKKSIIDRIQKVWSRASDTEREFIDDLFRQFLEVITMPDGEERDKQEKALVNHLKHFEAGGKGKQPVI